MISKMPTNQAEKPVAIVTGPMGHWQGDCRGDRQSWLRSVMVCRDEKRAARALDEVRRATGSSDVRVELADLSRRESVFALVARWQGRLDVLVNNAAVAPGVAAKPRGNRDAVRDQRARLCVDDACL